MRGAPEEVPGGTRSSGEQFQAVSRPVLSACKLLKMLTSPQLQHELLGGDMPGNPPSPSLGEGAAGPSGPLFSFIFYFIIIITIFAF